MGTLRYRHKSLLPVWALMVAILFGVAGCFGGKDKSGEDAVTGSRVIDGVQYGKLTVYTVGKVRKRGSYQNEIVGAPLSDPKTFNPVTANESSSTDILEYIFEGLTVTNYVTGEVEPCLAESWESSEDGLVWTFHLRRNARFSDGKEVTADDVLFSFNDVYLDEDIPGVAMRDILKIEGKYPLVEKVDDDTVRITLPARFAPFVRMVQGVYILPKHILEEAVEAGNFASTWNVDADPKTVVGTGPVKLSSYRSGDRVVLTANEHYWFKDAEGRQLPLIEKMTLLICSDLNTRMLKFKSGQTDACPLRGEDYAALRKLAIKNDFSIYDRGGVLGTEFLMLNQNVVGVPREKQVWFRDLEFRKACAYAIDRETIIRNVLLGAGESLDAAEPASNPLFHNPNVKKYRYDLAKAKQILKEAGYVDSDADGIIEKPRGVPVKFILTTNTGNNIRENMCQIITTDLKELGMDVTFSPLEFNNLISKIQSSLDWEAMVMGLTGSIDPHWGKNVWAHDGRTHFWNQKPQKPSEESQLPDWRRRVQAWETGIRDWEIEIGDFFDKGAQEMDQEERIKIYWKHQELVAEELPMIYTVTPTYLAAVKNKFKNLKPTTLVRRLYHNIGRELEVVP